MEYKEQNGRTAGGNGQQHLAGKYLTFALQDELYGVQILKVQEIIGIMPVTRVPRSPKYLKGVINLRGRVIPVVDLRLKLEMPEQEYTEKTCIIVVNISAKGRDVMVGVIIDSVREVYDFSPDELEAAPRFGLDVDTTSIIGMGKINEEVVTLLDIDKALSETDLKRVLGADGVSESADPEATTCAPAR